jgi:hypothetical protein
MEDVLRDLIGALQGICFSFDASQSLGKIMRAMQRWEVENAVLFFWLQSLGGALFEFESKLWIMEDIG